jgi:hypothetical protein
MSTGTAASAEGSVQAVPVRSHFLSRLEAERRQAEGCFEWQRAAELAAQIRQMSAGTPASPARETTARRTAARKR